MSISGESLQLFHGVVETIFNNWTALRLAVEHGMGTKETAAQMVDYVTQLFKENPNISSEEVGDVLEDLMDSEFQTLCEDNSAAEIGEVLWNFHQRCLTNDKSYVESEMSKLPKTNLWLCKPLIVTNNHTVQNTNSETSLQCDTVNETNSNNTPVEEMAEDSEWTTVRARRKK